LAASNSRCGELRNESTIRPTATSTITKRRSATFDDGILLEEVADTSTSFVDVSALDRSTPERRPPLAGDKETETSKTSKPTKPKRKTTGKVSKHFKPPLVEKPIPKPPAGDIDEPLNLPPAQSRRVQWTPPPKDTVKEFGSRSSDIIELLSSTNRVPDAVKARDVFKQLNDSYGYEEEDIGIRNATPEPGQLEIILKKRKLLEMVPTTAENTEQPAPPEKSPAKSKAPKKKKARTITGLATAAYVPRDREATPELDMEADRSDSKTRAKNPITTKPTKAAAPKRKTRPTKRTKKKEEPEIILLSPGAALKHVANQDFVFGTSSQLARQQLATNSDGLPRLRAGPATDDEFVTPINSDAIEPPEAQPRLWTAAARDEDGGLLHTEIIDLVDSPRLDGEVDDVDPFGYVNMDKRPSQLTSSRATGTQQSRVTKSVDSSTTNRGFASKGTATLQKNGASQSTPIESMLSYDPSSWVISSTSPPPSSQKRLPRIYELEALSGKSELPASSRVESPTKAPEPRVPEPNLPQRPNFELCTDAQLSKQIASYGFKPIKKRDGMISLLTQCWESKHLPQAELGAVRAYSTASAPPAIEMTPQGTSTSSKVDDSLSMPPPPSKPAGPVKPPRGRPRKNLVPLLNSDDSDEPPPSSQVPEVVSEKRRPGRPRKSSTAAATKTATSAIAAKPSRPSKGKAPTTPKKKTIVKAPVLEIPDSDSEMLVSSPESVFSSPPSFDISVTTEDDTQLSLALSPTEKEAELFRYITQAVTTAPRSKDPQNPSWHEKMLMYESIILEDLAAWLNTGQLSRVGCDAEVSPVQVKKWCESKSICCLWRQRMNGLDRKRL